MAIVLDVSVAATWCFPDEQTVAADRVLDELPRVGGAVPGIFWYEIRNVLVVNERRGRIDRVGGARFLMRLRNLRLQYDDNHDEETVMELAREYALSAYDASYLETAMRRGDDLATLDRALAAAADSEGVTVIH